MRTSIIFAFAVAAILSAGQIVTHNSPFCPLLKPVVAQAPPPKCPPCGCKCGDKGQ